MDSSTTPNLHHYLSPLCAGLQHPGVDPATQRACGCQILRRESPGLPQKGQSRDILEGQATWEPFMQESPWVRKVFFSHTHRTGHWGNGCATQRDGASENNSLPPVRTGPCESLRPSGILYRLWTCIFQILCSAAEKGGLGFRQTWLQILFHFLICGHL